MVIDLKKVFSAEGSLMQASYTLDLSRVEFDSCYPFRDPVSVDVAVKNRFGIVTLNLKVECKYYHACDRCMVETEKCCRYSFDHVVVSDDDETEEDGCIFVDNYILELDEVVKSDLFLEMPSKVLCRDDCKGICFKCGKNLNFGKCDCVTSSVDPRLEVLRSLID